ncbi:MAG: signal peptidase II [Ignavibacteriae bacterium]|nr:signal peptidase II [Ignavibacteriota bacterium]
MRVLYLTVFVVVFDQLTKVLVKGINIPFLNLDLSGMRYGQSFNIIGEFVKFTFVENPGMAFGIDVGETSKLFLSLFSIIASIGILIYLFKLKDEKLILRLALALILGGAIGNMIDRTFYGIFYGYAPIFYGRVVDFINVDFFDFSIFGRTYERWPIFNIADSAVTVGVILLLIFQKPHSEEKVKDSDEEIKTESGDDINEINSEQMVSIDGENNNRKDNRPVNYSGTEEGKN